MLERHLKQLSHPIIISMLVLLLMPLNQAFIIKPDDGSKRSAHFKTVEYAVEKREQYESSRESPRKLKSDTRRSIHSLGASQCSQQRLEDMLRSCEAAAAIPAPRSTSDPPTQNTLRDRTKDAPLYFCGPNCSHLVFIYANECNMREFLVNVSGACKLQGENLTIECIFAVVIVKEGIAACTKMVLDINSMHDIDDNFTNLDDSSQYVDEQCCSLETSYQSDVTHTVSINTMGRIVTNPPLEPPWLMTNSSSYQAVLDVVSSNLCLVATTTGTTITTTITGSLPNSQNMSTTMHNGVYRTLSLHWICRFLCIFLYFVSSLNHYIAIM